MRKTPCWTLQSFAVMYAAPEPYAIAIVRRKSLQKIAARGTIKSRTISWTWRTNADDSSGVQNSDSAGPDDAISEARILPLTPVHHCTESYVVTLRLTRSRDHLHDRGRQTERSGSCITVHLCLSVR